jgi:hypothetical protein
MDNIQYVIEGKIYVYAIAASLIEKYYQLLL